MDFKDRMEQLREWSQTRDETASMSVREIAAAKEGRKPPETKERKNPLPIVALVLMGIITVGSIGVATTKVSDIRAEEASVRADIEATKGQTEKLEKDIAEVPKKDDLKDRIAQAQKSANAIATVQTEWIGEQISTDGSDDEVIVKRVDEMKKYVTKSAAETNNFGLTNAWMNPSTPKRDKHGLVTGWKPAKKGEYTWVASTIKSIDVDGTIRAGWQLEEKKTGEILAWAVAQYVGNGQFGGFNYSITSYGKDFIESTEADPEDINEADNASAERDV